MQPGQHLSQAIANTMWCSITLLATLDGSSGQGWPDKTQPVNPHEQLPANAAITLLDWSGLAFTHLARPLLSMQQRSETSVCVWTLHLSCDAQTAQDPMQS